MDQISARLWEVSQFRGNAFLLLQLIAYSISEGQPRPKLDDLAARMKLTYRQTQRLIEALTEAQELQIIEKAGRGTGNLYDIPTIRPLLTAAIQAEFDAYDMRRMAALLSERATETPPFTESTSEMSPLKHVGNVTSNLSSFEIVTSDLSSFGLESTSETSSKAERTTETTRIQSRRSLSLNTELNKREDREGGQGETEQPARRRRRRQAGTETPFPEDFQITAEMLEWARSEVPGLDVRFATGSWQDKAKSKGWVFVDWTAAWKNGMRMAFKWATQDGIIKQAPAPAANPQPPAPRYTDADRDEFERNRELMNQPCSVCGDAALTDCPNCHGTGREPLSKILAEMGK